MKILQRINSPADLRKLNIDQLQDVADDIREHILETMSRVGGHTGASLGAVELAVALHYAFNTPEDRLVWDVGHQAYAHKILTGRRDHVRRAAAELSATASAAPPPNSPRPSCSRAPRPWSPSRTAPSASTRPA